MQNGVGKMSIIGVLSMQGAVAEHLDLLAKIDGVQVLQVKKASQLDDIDGLIMPGGESTTMGKLLRQYNIMDPLRERIKRGMPVWGTCAGMILLAQKIINHDDSYLGVLDVTVRRNAYGSQLDSFHTTALIPKIADYPLPLTFIRAPYIEEAGPEVEVLLSLDGKIVAVEQNNVLATSFHPELNEDLSFHQYFVNKVKKAYSMAS